MSDISVEYMGLKLKSPFIAGSCGMTADYERVGQMEQMGIGAVVVKSLFEEQINNEVQFVSGVSVTYPEMADYLHGYIRQYSIEKYIRALEKIRFAVSIPVIASINCYNPGEWVAYAKDMEKAGADALEVNLYDIPMSVSRKSEEIEREYYQVIENVIKSVKIPVAFKISSHFTNIPAFVNNIAIRGAKAIVLFNRFYTPDINLETMNIVPASPISQPSDYQQTLRWTALVSSLVKNIQISSTTGVHTPSTGVKQILAGATTVQLCSVLYNEGLESIAGFNEYLEKFMEREEVESIGEIRGRLNYANVGNPAIFERVQFIKSFGGYTPKK